MPALRIYVDAQTVVRIQPVLEQHVSFHLTIRRRLQHRLVDD